MRHRGRASLIVALAFLFMAACAQTVQAHEHEPPYQDIRRHWAEAMIQLLWEEGLTDGYSVSGYRPFYGTFREQRFYPDRPMRADAWLTLAAKVFDLTPVHPAPSHRLESGQQVGGWLRAAELAGWTVPRSWEQTLQREQAFHDLMIALGLGDYAASLSTSEIQRELARYRDAGQIDSRYRATLAAGTRLGIIEGYPDRRLRPRQTMTRAEAVAVLARSALARVDAAPNPFYPGSPGADNTTTFTLGTLKNRNLSRWLLEVLAPGGEVLWRTGTAYGGPAAPPAYVHWDGRNRNDTLLPPGLVFYRFTVWDSKQQVFQSPRKPLELRWRRLEGGLTPDRLKPGETVQVWATTWGDPERVWAQLASTSPQHVVTLQKHAASSTSQAWRGQWTVPAGTAPGVHTVMLYAAFPGTTLQLPLLLTIEDPLRFSASLTPTRLAAGELLTITAVTSPQFHTVVAETPDGAVVPLDRIHTTDQERRWQAVWQTPVTLADGEYPLVVRGRSPLGDRSQRLHFQIAGDLRERIEVMLTD